MALETILLQDQEGVGWHIGECPGQTQAAPDGRNNSSHSNDRRTHHEMERTNYWDSPFKRDSELLQLDPFRHGLAVLGPQREGFRGYLDLGRLS